MDKRERAAKMQTVTIHDSTGSHPTTIGNDMTEAEALVCATALNAHDRKVRGFKS
jgi:hypothetical protein